MAKRNGDQLLEVLTLGLEGEIFALEATQVREILDIVPITWCRTAGLSSTA